MRTDLSDRLRSGYGDSLRGSGADAGGAPDLSGGVLRSLAGSVHKAGTAEGAARGWKTRKKQLPPVEREKKGRRRGVRESKSEAQLGHYRRAAADRASQLGGAKALRAATRSEIVGEDWDAYVESLQRRNDLMLDFVREQSGRGASDEAHSLYSSWAQDIHNRKALGWRSAAAADLGRTADDEWFDPEVDRNMGLRSRMARGADELTREAARASKAWSEEVWRAWHGGAPTPVFRGVGLSEADLGALDRGEPLDFGVNALSSWSTDPDAANFFGNVIVEMEASPEDVWGYYRAHVLLDDDESEVILGHPSPKLRLTPVRKRGDKWVVRAEPVHAAEKALAPARHLDAGDNGNWLHAAVRRPQAEPGAERRPKAVGAAAVDKAGTAEGAKRGWKTRKKQLPPVEETPSGGRKGPGRAEEPGPTGGRRGAPPGRPSVPAGTAAESAPAAAPAEPPPVAFSDLKKVGGQRGSVPGGTYEDERTGERYYVKTPRTAEHARNEVLAARLYQLAGVAVPEVQLVDVRGKQGVASKIVGGLSRGRKSDDWSKVPGAHEGFVADAWLGNWDVVGLEFDNMLRTEDGRAMRLDTGGALRFRAQGAPKGAAFGRTVGELDSLRDRRLNPQAAAVFGGVSDEDLEAGASRVLGITDAQIDAAVAGSGPSDADEAAALADTLKARRDDIGARFPGVKSAIKAASVVRAAFAAVEKAGTAEGAKRGWKTRKKLLPPVEPEEGEGRRPGQEEEKPGKAGGKKIAIDWLPKPAAPAAEEPSPKGHKKVSLDWLSAGKAPSEAKPAAEPAPAESPAEAAGIDAVNEVGQHLQELGEATTDVNAMLGAWKELGLDGYDAASKAFRGVNEAYDRGADFFEGAGPKTSASDAAKAKADLAGALDQTKAMTAEYQKKIDGLIAEVGRERDMVEAFGKVAEAVKLSFHQKSNVLEPKSSLNYVAKNLEQMRDPKSLSQNTWFVGNTAKTYRHVMGKKEEGVYYPPQSASERSRHNLLAAMKGKIGKGVVKQLDLADQNLKDPKVGKKIEAAKDAIAKANAAIDGVSADPGTAEDAAAKALAAKKAVSSAKSAVSRANKKNLASFPKPELKPVKVRDQKIAQQLEAYRKAAAEHLEKSFGGDLKKLRDSTANQHNRTQYMHSFVRDALKGHGPPGPGLKPLDPNQGAARVTTAYANWSGSANSGDALNWRGAALQAYGRSVDDEMVGTAKASGGTRSVLESGSPYARASLVAAKPWAETVWKAWHGDKPKTVYRGVSPPNWAEIRAALDSAGEAELGVNSLSSWSESKAKASAFGSGKVVIHQDITPDRVWGFYRAHPMHSDGEQEVVVGHPHPRVKVRLLSKSGHTYHVQVVDVEPETQKALDPAGGPPVILADYGENADWLHGAVLGHQTPGADGPAEDEDEVTPWDAWEDEGEEEE